MDDSTTSVPTPRRRGMKPVSGAKFVQTHDEAVAEAAAAGDGAALMRGDGVAGGVADDQPLSAFLRLVNTKSHERRAEMTEGDVKAGRVKLAQGTDGHYYFAEGDATSVGGEGTSSARHVSIAESPRDGRTTRGATESRLTAGPSISQLGNRSGTTDGLPSPRGTTAATSKAAALTGATKNALMEELASMTSQDATERISQLTKRLDAMTDYFKSSKGHSYMREPKLQALRDDISLLEHHRKILDMRDAEEVAQREAALQMPALLPHLARKAGGSVRVPTPPAGGGARPDDSPSGNKLDGDADTAYSPPKNLFRGAAAMVGLGGNKSMSLESRPGTQQSAAASAAGGKSRTDDMSSTMAPDASFARGGATGSKGGRSMEHIAVDDPAKQHEKQLKAAKEASNFGRAKQYVSEAEAKKRQLLAEERDSRAAARRDAQSQAEREQHLLKARQQRGHWISHGDHLTTIYRVLAMDALACDRPPFCLETINLTAIHPYTMWFVRTFVDGPLLRAFVQDSSLVTLTHMLRVIDEIDVQHRAALRREAVRRRAAAARKLKWGSKVRRAASFAPSAATEAAGSTGTAAAAAAANSPSGGDTSSNSTPPSVAWTVPLPDMSSAIIDAVVQHDVTAIAVLLDSHRVFFDAERLNLRHIFLRVVLLGLTDVAEQLALHGVFDANFLHLLFLQCADVTAIAAEQTTKIGEEKTLSLTEFVSSKTVSPPGPGNKKSFVGSASKLAASVAAADALDMSGTVAGIADATSASSTTTMPASVSAMAHANSVACGGIPASVVQLPRLYPYFSTPSIRYLWGDHLTTLGSVRLQNQARTAARSDARQRRAMAQEAAGLDALASGFVGEPTRVGGPAARTSPSPGAPTPSSADGEALIRLVPGPGTGPTPPFTTPRHGVPPTPSGGAAPRSAAAKAAAASVTGPCYVVTATVPEHHVGCRADVCAERNTGVWTFEVVVDGDALISGADAIRVGWSTERSEGVDGRSEFLLGNDETSIGLSLCAASDAKALQSSQPQPRWPEYVAALEDFEAQEALAAQAVAEAAERRAATRRRQQQQQQLVQSPRARKKAGGKKSASVATTVTDGDGHDSPSTREAAAKQADMELDEMLDDLGSRPPIPTASGERSAWWDASPVRQNQLRQRGPAVPRLADSEGIEERLHENLIVDPDELIDPDAAGMTAAAAAAARNHERGRRPPKTMLQPLKHSGGQSVACMDAPMPVDLAHVLKYALHDGSGFRRPGVRDPTRPRAFTSATGDASETDSDASNSDDENKDAAVAQAPTGAINAFRRAVAITCVLDTDRAECSYFLNGQWLGLTFDRLPRGHKFYPTVSMTQYKPAIDISVAPDVTGSAPSAASLFHPPAALFIFDKRAMFAPAESVMVPRVLSRDEAEKRHAASRANRGGGQSTTVGAAAVGFEAEEPGGSSGKLKRVAQGASAALRFAMSLTSGNATTGAGAGKQRGGNADGGRNLGVTAQQRISGAIAPRLLEKSVADAIRNDEDAHMAWMLAATAHDGRAAPSPSAMRRLAVTFQRMASTSRFLAAASTVAGGDASTRSTGRFARAHREPHEADFGPTALEASADDAASRRRRRRRHGGSGSDDDLSFDSDDEDEDEEEELESDVEAFEEDAKVTAALARAMGQAVPVVPSLASDPAPASHDAVDLAGESPGHALDSSRTPSVVPAPVSTAGSFRATASAANLVSSQRGDDAQSYASFRQTKSTLGATHRRAQRALLKRVTFDNVPTRCFDRAAKIDRFIRLAAESAATTVSPSLLSAGEQVASKLHKAWTSCATGIEADAVAAERLQTDGPPVANLAAGARARGRSPPQDQKRSRGNNTTSASSHARGRVTSTSPTMPVFSLAGGNNIAHAIQQAAKRSLVEQARALRVDVLRVFRANVCRSVHHRVMRSLTAGVDSLCRSDLDGSLDDDLRFDDDGDDTSPSRARNTNASSVSNARRSFREYPLEAVALLIAYHPTIVTPTLAEGVFVNRRLVDRESPLSATPHVPGGDDELRTPTYVPISTFDPACDGPASLASLEQLPVAAPTPIITALYARLPDAAETLAKLPYTDVVSADRGGHTPLMLAAALGYTSVVRVIVDRLRADGKGSMLLPPSAKDIAAAVGTGDAVAGAEDEADLLDDCQASADDVGQQAQYGDGGQPDATATTTTTTTATSVDGVLVRRPRSFFLWNLHVTQWRRLNPSAGAAAATGASKQPHHQSPPVTPPKNARGKKESANDEKPTAATTMASAILDAKKRITAAADNLPPQLWIAALAHKTESNDLTALHAALQTRHPQCAALMLDLIPSPSENEWNALGPDRQRRFVADVNSCSNAVTPHRNTPVVIAAKLGYTDLLRRLVEDYYGDLSVHDTAGVSCLLAACAYERHAAALYIIRQLEEREEATVAELDVARAELEAAIDHENKLRARRAEEAALAARLKQSREDARREMSALETVRRSKTGEVTISTNGAVEAAAASAAGSNNDAESASNARSTPSAKSSTAKPDVLSMLLSSRKKSSSPPDRRRSDQAGGLGDSTVLGLPGLGPAARATAVAADRVTRCLAAVDLATAALSVNVSSPQENLEQQRAPASAGNDVTPRTATPQRSRRQSVIKGADAAGTTAVGRQGANPIGRAGSAIHWAAARGFTDVVELLVGHGVSLSSVASGMTPLLCACAVGQASTARGLLRKCRAVALAALGRDEHSASPEASVRQDASTRAAAVAVANAASASEASAPPKPKPKRERRAVVGFRSTGGAFGEDEHGEELPSPGGPAGSADGDTSEANLRSPDGPRGAKQQHPANDASVLFESVRRRSTLLGAGSPLGVASPLSDGTLNAKRVRSLADATPQELMAEVNGAFSFRNRRRTVAIISAGAGDGSRRVSEAFLAGNDTDDGPSSKRGSDAVPTNKTSAPAPKKRSKRSMSVFYEPGVDFAAIPTQRVIDVNAVDTKFASTALHLACERGQTDLIDELLALGADVNAATHTFDTPLHCCINQGHERAAVHLLLAAKRQIRCNVANRHGYTPLLAACQRGMRDLVYALVGVGDVDVNTPDQQGMSPLQCAIIHGHPECAEALLDVTRTPVEVNTSYRQKMPLERAVEAGYRDVARTLLHQYAAEAPDAIRDLVADLAAGRWAPPSRPPIPQAPATKHTGAMLTAQLLATARVPDRRPLRRQPTITAISELRHAATAQRVEQERIEPDAVSMQLQQSQKLGGDETADLAAAALANQAELLRQLSLMLRGLTLGELQHLLQRVLTGGADGIEASRELSFYVEAHTIAGVSVSVMTAAAFARSAIHLVNTSGTGAGCPILLPAVPSDRLTLRLATEFGHMQALVSRDAASGSRSALPGERKRGGGGGNAGESVDVLSANFRRNRRVATPLGSLHPVAADIFATLRTEAPTSSKFAEQFRRALKTWKEDVSWARSGLTEKANREREAVLLRAIATDLRGGVPFGGTDDAMVVSPQNNTSTASGERPPAIRDPTWYAGPTALHRACALSSPNAVRALVDFCPHGTFNPNTVCYLVAADAAATTAVHACRSNRHAVAFSSGRWKSVDQAAIGRGGAWYLPLRYAVERGDVALAKALLDCFPHESGVVAASSAFDETANPLTFDAGLSGGTSPSAAADGDSESTLGYAVQEAALDVNKLEPAELLPSQESLLHVAVRRRDKRFVRLLLANGAAVFAKNAAGYTCCMAAALRPGGRVDTTDATAIEAAAVGEDPVEVSRRASASILRWIIAELPPRYLATCDAADAAPGEPISHHDVFGASVTVSQPLHTMSSAVPMSPSSGADIAEVASKPFDSSTASQPFASGPSSPAAAADRTNYNNTNLSAASDRKLARLFAFTVLHQCREAVPALLHRGLPADVVDDETGDTLLTAILSSPAPRPPVAGAGTAVLFGGGHTLGEYALPLPVGGTAASGAAPTPAPASTATDSSAGAAAGGDRAASRGGKRSAIAAAAASADCTLTEGDKRLAIMLLREFHAAPNQVNARSNASPLYLAACHHDLELSELIMSLILDRANEPPLRDPAAASGAGKRSGALRQAIVQQNNNRVPVWRALATLAYPKAKSAMVLRITHSIDTAHARRTFVREVLCRLHPSTVLALLVQFPNDASVAPQEGCAFWQALFFVTAFGSPSERHAVPRRAYEHLLRIMFPCMQLFTLVGILTYRTRRGDLWRNDGDYTLLQQRTTSRRNRYTGGGPAASTAQNRVVQANLAAGGGDSSAKLDPNNRSRVTFGGKQSAASLRAEDASSPTPTVTEEFSRSLLARRESRVATAGAAGDVATLASVGRRPSMARRESDSAAALAELSLAAHADISPNAKSGRSASMRKRRSSVGGGSASTADDVASVGGATTMSAAAPANSPAGFTNVQRTATGGVSTAVVAGSSAPLTFDALLDRIMDLAFPGVGTGAPYLDFLGDLLDLTARHGLTELYRYNQARSTHQSKLNVICNSRGLSFVASACNRPLFLQELIKNTCDASDTDTVGSGEIRLSRLCQLQFLPARAKYAAPLALAAAKALTNSKSNKKVAARRKKMLAAAAAAKADGSSSPPPPAAISAAAAAAADTDASGQDSVQTVGPEAVLQLPYTLADWAVHYSPFVPLVFQRDAAAPLISESQARQQQQQQQQQELDADPTDVAGAAAVAAAEEHALNAFSGNYDADAVGTQAEALFRDYASMASQSGDLTPLPATTFPVDAPVAIIRSHSSHHHATLTRAVPAPSFDEFARVIDHLLDCRCPLSVPLVVFLRSSPRFGLNYVSERHRDSLLHIAILRDQPHIAHFILKSAVSQEAFEQMASRARGGGGGATGEATEEELTSREQAATLTSCFTRLHYRNRHGRTATDYVNSPTMLQLLAAFRVMHAGAGGGVVEVAPVPFMKLAEGIGRASNDSALAAFLQERELRIRLRERVEAAQAKHNADKAAAAGNAGGPSGSVSQRIRQQQADAIVASVLGGGGQSAQQPFLLAHPANGAGSPGENSLATTNASPVVASLTPPPLPAGAVSPSGRSALAQRKVDAFVTSDASGRGGAAMPNLTETDQRLNSVLRGATPLPSKDRRRSQTFFMDADPAVLRRERDTYEWRSAVEREEAELEAQEALANTPSLRHSTTTMPDAQSSVAGGYRAGGAHHELAALGAHGFDAFDDADDEHADPADPRVIPEYNAWLRGAEENWAIDDGDDDSTALRLTAANAKPSSTVVASRADTGMSHGSGSTAAPPSAVAHQLVADHVVAALANADRKAQYDRRLAEATKSLTRLGFAVSRAVYTVERVLDGNSNDADSARASRTSTAPTASMHSPRQLNATSSVGVKVPRPPPAGAPSRLSSTANGGFRSVSVNEAMHSDPITSRVRVRVQLPEARVASDAAEHLAASASGGGAGHTQQRTITRIPGFATADHPSARGEQGAPAHKSCVLLVSLPPYQLCKLQNAFKVSPYSRTVHWTDEFDTTDVSSSVAAAVATAVAEAMGDGKPIPARRAAAIQNETRLTADVAAARYTESHLQDVAESVMKSFNLAVVPHYGLGAPPGAPPSRPPPLLATTKPGTRERPEPPRLRSTVVSSSSRATMQGASPVAKSEAAVAPSPDDRQPTQHGGVSAATLPNVGNKTPSLPPVAGAKPVGGSGRPYPKTARR